MMKIMNLKIFIFCCACLSGAIVAVLWRNFEHRSRKQTLKVAASLHDTKYQNWLQKQGLERKHFPEEWLSYKREGYNRDILETEADFLKRTVKVLCVVKTKSRTRAKAVKDTWGPNCHSQVYWGDFTDDEIPVLQLPIEARLRSLISHIWLKYKFDWLFLTDDRTFSIIENLRLYVAPLNTSKPYYLGHPMQKQYFAAPYNLLDAGIVLSNGAALKLYKKLEKANGTMQKSSMSIDEEIGNYLEGIANVTDTRDSRFRGRFNPFTPEEMIIPGSISVFNPYWRNSLFLNNDGMDSCSDSAISFHGISHVQMHLLNYLTHSLAIFRHSMKGTGNKKAPNNLFEIPGNKRSDPTKELHVGKSSVKLIIPGNVQNYPSPQNVHSELHGHMEENEV